MLNMSINNQNEFNEMLKAKPSKIRKEKIPKHKKKNSFANDFFHFFLEVLICFLVVYFLSNYVIRPVQVKGNSMYPTLKDNSIGFSNILGRKISSIERFDIVIVYLPEKNEYIVKRVIGLPNETVSYENGQLYINGQYVEEDFLDDSYVSTYNNSFMSDVEPITLGDDEYFCLGDNRPHSSDSRVYGPFKKENILSKGVFIFFPFTEFGVDTW